MEKKNGIFARIRILIRKFGNGLKYSRLDGSLTSYENELERRILHDKSENVPWVIQSRKLLIHCRHFLNVYKIDEAWKCYHAARRLEVFGMGPEERENLSIEIREEASKLKEWRKRGVLTLIGATNSPIPSNDVLYHALYIKDEQNDNMYYINSVTRRLFTILFLLLVVNLTGILLFTYDWVRCGNGSFIGKMPLLNELIGVLLFSFLGAITSTIIFTRNQAQLSNISELGSDWMISFSKILVAGGFAVFIYFILNSSITDQIKLFSFKLNSSFDYFLVAFICGFSERFAQKAIDALIGKVDSKEQKENKEGTEKNPVTSENIEEKGVKYAKYDITVTDTTIRLK